MASRVAPLTVCLLILSVFAGCGGSNFSSGSDTSSPRGGALMQAKGFLEDFTDWDEAPAQVVGPSANAAFPCVLYHGGSYMMWTDMENTGGGVVLRTSTDGKTWSATTDCGLRGARHMRVLYNDGLGKFEAWYWGGGNDYDMSFWFHAVSSDGATWTRDATACRQASGHRLAFTAWTGNIGSHGPAQVFFNGGTATTLDYANIWANRYVMYYHQFKGAKYGIGVAVSNDGVLWGVPVEGQMVLAPSASGWDSKSATFGSIIREGGKMHMFYGGGTTSIYGGDGIGYATSTDGLVWEKAAPILLKNDGVAWRSNYMGPPSALMVNGERTLFTYAFAGGTDYLVGLAKPDLTPPVIALDAANPAVLFPANGNDVAVTFTGKAFDAKSGLAQATLKVVDEYGVQSQTIDLTSVVKADGTFTQTIPLNASRNPDDADGRRFVVTVSAVDNKENAAEPVSVTVLVPHDRNDGSTGDGPGNGTGNGNGYGNGNANGSKN